MKRAINSILLVLGFLPFFLFGAEPEWIPPTYEETEKWRYASFTPRATPEEACSLASWWDSPTYQSSVEPSGDPNLMFCVQWLGQIGNSGYRKQDNVIRVLELSPVCNEPDYQNGIDSDNLDGIDQCWPSSCPDDGIMWSNGNGVSTPTGSICVVNPISNQNCKYNAIENTDGSRSNFTFVQSGEGCSCGNELVPCNPLEDGEITNYPQGQDGCVAMGDSIFCGADPEVECNNGVCNAGCGYVGTEFMCVESQIDPVETDPCLEGDLRPSCSGVPDGDCPNGVLNCGDNSSDPETPPAPCAANDPRQECAGLNEGEIPDSSRGGATTEDISGLSSLLEQGNRNTNEIKNNTSDISEDTDAIKKALEETFSGEDADPAGLQDWTDFKTLYNQFTSSGDVNVDQTNFESNSAAQEGFFNNQVAGLIPTGGTCSNLSMQFSHANVVIDACQYLVHAKIVIEWAMLLGFLIYVRSTLTRLKPN